MLATYLAIFVPGGLAILGGLIQTARQNGRIEAGVKGLYERMDRLEDRVDRHYR